MFELKKTGEGPRFQKKVDTARKAYLNDLKTQDHTAESTDRREVLETIRKNERR